MIDGNTEIRKLTPRIILALAQILDPNYQWEILMSLIQEPDETSGGGYVDKYSMQDISLIREAGSKSGLSCTAIFLEEWGTSGRNRPTVRTLLELLVKAEMFRAADYLAVDVLKEAPPRRPDHWMDNEIFLTDTTSGQVTECFPSVCNENTVRCEELDKIRDDLMLRNDTNNGDLDQPNEKINYVNYETIKKITCNFNPTLKLGNGAFGSVYLGKLNDKKVAIKVLSIYEDYSNLLGHFKNELVILYERSEHPNVLPLLGASCDAVPCLIYEYMPNGSLEKRLACELKEFPPLTWQKRVSIANDVTEGLKYLHTLSIIHRDIKAANVLLDCNDVARIGDFGLVRKSGGMKTSSTALLQGTSVYMAPEALRGFISPKMDIFSFGVLLLELLTGLPGEREDGIGLYDYLQDVINKDEDFIAWLDEKAGIWETKIWTTMYTLFKNCTQHEKRLRPDISEVNSVMSSLREIV